MKIPSSIGTVFRGFFKILPVAVAVLCWGISDRLHGQTNPIASENALAGNLPSEWEVSGIGDPSILGFATEISVNRGTTVRFKVQTTAAAYRIDIYRLGYYAGRGARKVATINPSVSLPQTQPVPVVDAATGLADCGNWAVSASWAVPANATSGVYLARPVRTDTGGASHIVFIVRDDTGGSDILFQTADTTWHAYNDYGGASLYGGNGPGNGRAYKVSYNRPFNNRADYFASRLSRAALESFLFASEYPMIRWLEANGYHVSYAAGVDTDRRGSAALLSHKVFLSVGHDEYWSAQQRASVEAARAGGVHLGFFSANEMYWKTRWENSIAGTTTSYRTLVCYKETHANAKIDPTSAWTGTWRDPRFSPPADGGRPENAVTGQLYTVDAFQYDPMLISAREGKLRFWRNTGLDALPDGQSAQLPAGVLGWEWDEVVDNGFLPPGLLRMSTTTIGVERYLQDYGSTVAPGVGTHSLTLYRHSSGALVFGAGTINWSWGLDATHDVAGPAADGRMQQATVNLFADMGVQPLSLQPGLGPATQSTDTTPPTSVILLPPGGTVLAGTAVTTIGTATDAGGGKPAGVEFSLDGGTTWHPANGAANWSATWTPSAPGLVTIQSRAVDDSGRMETPGPGITITVVESSDGYTLWPPTETPAIIDQSHPGPLELGVKFTSDRAGWIKALRFYKNEANTGLHIGNLWTIDGTLLGTVTFTNETPSGWQEAPLATPIPITAGTAYVASYHLDSLHFSFDLGYFASQGQDRGPLHALANGVAGPNGVYLDGPSGFPTQTANASNYWVDVVFADTVTFDTTPPTITAVSPANGAPNVSPATSVTAQFDEAMALWSIGSPNYTYPYPNAQFSLNPPASQSQTEMLRDFRIGQDQQFSLTQVPNGIYDVYVWTLEDGNPQTATLSVEGSAVGTYTSGPAGRWDRLGPFRVTVTDGDIQVRVQSANDLAFVSGLEVWQGGGTPPPPPPTTRVFHRGINLGGPAIVIDGNNWEANTAATPNFVTNGFPGQSPTTVFNPVPQSPNHETMLRTFRFGTNLQLDLSSVPNGTYEVSLWTFEDNFSLNATLFLDGTVVVPNYTSGPAGRWDRFGPFPVTVGDGIIQIDYVLTAPPGDQGLLSGVEVWRTSVPLSPPAGTFYRGINVGGPAMVIDGHPWEGEGASNYTVNGGSNGFSLRDAQSNLVPASVSYDPITRVASLQPSFGLSLGAPYTATVKGGSQGVSDVAGNHLPSDFSWTFTTATGQPQAAPPTFNPGGGTYQGAQSVTLSDASPGAAIYYTTNGSTPTASSTRYTAAIAVASTTTIKAIAVVSGWINSTVASATYTIQASAPAAPSGLTASAPSASQISLAWVDNASNETGFKIERKTGPGGTYGQIATVGSNVLTYSDTGLTDGTAYFYRVRAVNASGDSGYSNEANVTTPLALPALRAASSNAAASGVLSLGINKPDGTVQGDVMVASIAVRPNTANITATGWTLIRRTNNSNATANSLAVYYKVAGASEPASYTWTFSTSTGAVGGIRSFSGIDPANPIDVEAGQNTASGLTHTAPSVTTRFANAMIVTSHAFASRATFTPPPGMTEAFDVASATVPAFDGESMEGNYQLQTATGSTGTRTATASNDADVGIAHTLGLRANALTSVSVPSAPNNLTASAVSGSQINLTWADRSSNETGFKIERKTGAGGSYTQIASVGVNVTTYADPSLTAGTTYFYRVRATNSGGDSAYAPEASATTLIAAPVAPSGLTAGAASGSQINLTWVDNSSIETGFKIERKTGAGGSYTQIASVGANVTTYADPSLTAGTTYFYRVRATNSGGDSAYAPEASATTLIAAPVAPSGLTAGATSGSQINLTWVDNSSNETGFKIERKTGAGGTYTQVASAGANVTTYADTSLTAGTTYFYRVRATNSGGDSAYAPEASATTLIAAPVAPSGLTAGAASGSQINLTWVDNSSNETGFKIERKTGVGGSYAEIATLGANVTGYSNTGLNESTTYFYRVRATNAGGNSAYSPETSATTFTPTTTFYRAINLGGPAITIDGNNWEANTAATPNFTTNGVVFTDSATVFSPAVDTARATMLRTFRDDANLQLQMTSIPNGTYEIYVWTFEDNSPLNATLSVGGNVVLASYNSGPAGRWDRLGPYPVTVSDGIIRIDFVCNTPDDSVLLSGVEVRRTAAPGGLTATATSGSQINLNWVDTSADETGFKIERKTGAAGTYAEIATVGANVTTYADTGLTSGVTYFYRVRATNGSGDSAYSAEASATTLVAAPAAPSGLTASTASSSQINLTWVDNSSNETGFKIERKTGAGGTYTQIATVGASVTAYSSTGLTEGTTYFYRVRATNAGGDSAYSPETSATTPLAPPAAPSGLTASAVSSSQINLTWVDNSSNETGFKIERKTGAGGTYAQIVTVGASVTTYSDTGLTAGTTYFYRVRATNAVGDSAYSPEASATTLSAPAAPSGLTANAISGTQINLIWVDNSSNETGFKIERKIGAGGTYAQIATVGASVTTYSDTGLTTSTTYFYRVRATNTVGDSAYSIEASATTLAAPTAPSGLIVTATSGTQINLLWVDNSSNETGFKIERKTGAGGTYAQIATVGASVTAYANTGLTTGTTYFYRVRATSASGDSGYAPEASATTGLPAFRSAASNGAPSGVLSLTIGKPAGTQAGDVMVASIAVRPSRVSITAPGWTRVKQIDNDDANSNTLVIYYKVAGAAEPANYSWTFGNSTGSAGGIQSFSGIKTGDPIDKESGVKTISGLTHTAPKVDTSNPLEMLITAHAFSSSARWTPPAGMTEAFDVSSQTALGSGGVSIEGNYQLQSAKGATGTRTATASNDADVGNAHTVALKNQ